jgi:hypothetical protein
MADTAFQEQFRQEMILGFERRQSILRDAVTTESVIKGNTATFLVADSGGAEAVTRGPNGLIPSRSDNFVQNSATLAEWHDKPRRTGFNIFAGQGDQRSLMQKTSMSVINRKVDDSIISTLNTGTVNSGAAAAAGLAMVQAAKVSLMNADVPWDGEVFALISPKFETSLEAINAYASADFIDAKPFADGQNGWADKVKVRNWSGIKWITHPGIPGLGTSGEKCFMFHRSAIGHAANTAGMSTAVGYDEEDDYSYARCSIFMGQTLLQNTGVYVMNHDATA